MEVVNRVAGNTGDPLPDSLSRGLVIAALQGVFSFISVRVDWLTVDDLVYLLPLLTLTGSLLWGVYDRWGRSKLPSA